MNRRSTGVNSTGRRQTESRETNGEEEDVSPWLEGSTRGGGSFAPHDSGGNHRSSLELRGDAIGDAQSPKREEGIRVRVLLGE
jgi:hypothetical protein